MKLRKMWCKHNFILNYKDTFYGNILHLLKGLIFKWRHSEFFPGLHFRAMVCDTFNYNRLITRSENMSKKVDASFLQIYGFIYCVRFSQVSHTTLG